MSKTPCQKSLPSKASLLNLRMIPICGAQQAQPLPVLSPIAPCPPKLKGICEGDLVMLQKSDHNIICFYKIFMNLRFQYFVYRNSRGLTRFCQGAVSFTSLSKLVRLSMDLIVFNLVRFVGKYIYISERNLQVKISICCILKNCNV